VTTAATALPFESDKVTFFSLSLSETKGKKHFPIRIIKIKVGGSVFSFSNY
jgi:hypothetical protein